MGIETVLFRSKEKKSREQVVNILRKIADKIEVGSIVLKQGSQTAKLNFPPNFNLKMKVEDDRGLTKLKKSLEVEFEWIDGAETNSSETEIA